MIKITSFFTSLVILFGSVFAALLPSAPKPMTQTELLSVHDTIKKKELSDTVYAVDTSGFTADERDSAIALQGIVARQNPCIYLSFGSVYESYLKDIEKSGKKIVRTDENGAKWTYKSLVLQFFDYIGDGGYTLYENSELAEGRNVATNFATAYGWLPVPVSVQKEAEECGLVLKKDVSKEKYGISFQRRYFKMLRSSFEKGTLVHVFQNMQGLRDLAIAQGYFCFYTTDDTQGNLFLREVLRWSGKNTSVYGWCEHEKKFVEILSKLGCHVNPADHSYNCSYLSQVTSDVAFECSPAKAHTDESKHYATLVFTDGDNCQWIQNGFGEFHTTVKNYPNAKISWTFSPVLKNFCSPAYARTAAAANENTSFLCGPSGFGYCNPSLFDSKSLDLFSTETASSMLKSNMRVLTILDDYSAIKEGKMAWSFSYFSRFDNIDGGILFLDPGRYESGKGKVWFSNDKPFASVRLSLWAENGYDGATDEWIKQQAGTVNQYPVDIHSIDGYSVICIHAWTMKPESIDKFIGLLDEQIEILSVDDFIATMKENIPHKTAAPTSAN